MSGQYSAGYRKWVPRLLVLLMVMDVLLFGVMVVAAITSARAGSWGVAWMAAVVVVAANVLFALTWRRWRALKRGQR